MSRPDGTCTGSAGARARPWGQGGLGAPRSPRGVQARVQAGGGPCRAPPLAGGARNATWDCRRSQTTGREGGGHGGGGAGSGDPSELEKSGYSPSLSSCPPPPHPHPNTFFFSSKEITRKSWFKKKQKHTQGVGEWCRPRPSQLEAIFWGGE